jgi:hypothetical protein
MILLELQYSVLPECAELSGHCTAVNAQIVGELLAVEGNVKFIFSALHRLRRKI